MGMLSQIVGEKRILLLRQAAESSTIQTFLYEAGAYSVQSVVADSSNTYNASTASVELGKKNN
jgi:hypothetical protein